jgi:phosphoribosylformylglycinamidine cyclo-ligase
LYTTEQYAKEIIRVSEKFGVEAKIIGRVEPSSQKRVTVKSEFGEFVYS